MRDKWGQVRCFAFENKIGNFIAGTEIFMRNCGEILCFALDKFNFIKIYVKILSNSLCGLIKQVA